mmetsp:Transcript_33253/g.99045  ORF Transcript_33253/g.99045 Transcript_33253/m.99045 type:complete len:321 (+) Transcript_33253:342-1304(+)
MRLATQGLAVALTASRPNICTRRAFKRSIPFQGPLACFKTQPGTSGGAATALSPSTGRSQHRPLQTQSPKDCSHARPCRLPPSPPQGRAPPARQPRHPAASQHCRGAALRPPCTPPRRAAAAGRHCPCDRAGPAAGCCAPMPAMSPRWAPRPTVCVGPSPSAQRRRQPTPDSPRGRPASRTRRVPRHAAPAAPTHASGHAAGPRRRASPPRQRSSQNSQPHWHRVQANLQHQRRPLHTRCPRPATPRQPPFRQKQRRRRSRPCPMADMIWWCRQWCMPSRRHARAALRLPGPLRGCACCRVHQKAICASLRRAAMRATPP